MLLLPVRLTNGKRLWYNANILQLGEVSEWFKEPVLKTGDFARSRGFESHPLRQKKLSRQALLVGFCSIVVFW